MPYSHYLPERMGSIVLSPTRTFVAGSHAELTLTYAAGMFGIDDTGMIKVSWRTTSDMSKPQFTDPKAENYTTVEASNGAKLEIWFDRLNIRPFANTILIRVGRGYLREGDTVTLRMGDRRQGSPGYRLQTNCERNVALKTSIDAFATYEFTELPGQPTFDLIPGPAESWKAIAPSLVVSGEPFRLALVAEDMWGNPTADVQAQLEVTASQPIQGLPAMLDVDPGKAPIVIDGLVAQNSGDLEIALSDAQGRPLARANPMRVVSDAPRLRCYWGDLHGQSGETIGMRTAEEYFAYARDEAFIDIVGHQGNDFQITDEFWRELNELTAKFNEPGKFVCLPGYEWSGNTGMGGDRNIFYRREGRPIRRSSHILVEGQTSTEALYTATELFEALKGEDARVIAHVGGRYADIKMAHEPRLERSVEVHSTWGTFEWLLHDAFDMGYRVGVVCHSDDHKGRPGATRPGASTFGAIGGLTCYFMPELTRDAVFEALRRRRHYGTTGTRIFIDLRGTFDKDVLRFNEDPSIEPNDGERTREVAMGDILRARTLPMRLTAEVIGTAPVERVDVFERERLVHTVRPFTAADLGRRVRVLWQGAEYRGRGRETMWRGTVKIDGNRIAKFARVNILNPERKIIEKSPGTELQWISVTTGNLAGIDLWLEDAYRGRLTVDTNIVSASVDLSTLRDQVITVAGGGLGRQLSVYRLPEEDWSRRVAVEHIVAHSGSADLPVFVRVTQSDGNQAWTSPIYLIP